MKSEHPLDKITEKDLQIIKILKSVREIRPDVLEFAYAMEMVLRKHDGVKGNSWKHCDYRFLAEKLTDEFDEVGTAFENFGCNEFREGHEDLCAEVVDLANIAMMIWNRAQKTE